MKGGQIWAEVEAVQGAQEAVEAAREEAGAADAALPEDFQEVGDEVQPVALEAAHPVVFQLTAVHQGHSEPVIWDR